MLIVVLLALAAAQLGDLEHQVIVTASYVSEGNLNRASKEVRAGLDLATNVLARVGRERAECVDEQCRTTAATNGARAVAAQSKIQALKVCLDKLLRSSGNGQDCVAAAVGGTAFPATLKKDDVDEPIREAVASAVAGGSPNDSAGNKAVQVLSERLKLLANRQKDCTSKECSRIVSSEQYQLRREARLLARIERCVARFQDTILRAKCIGPKQDELVRLLNAGKTGVQSVSREVDALNSAVTVPRSIVAASAKAVNEASAGAVTEAQTVADAIAALRTRVEAMDKASKVCDELSGGQRRECLRRLDESRSVNKRERNLLHRADACARRFKDNAVRRQNCVTRVARSLMGLLRPLPTGVVPPSVADLASEEEKREANLQARLTQLTRDLNNCGDDRACREAVQNAVLVTNVELNSIDVRFAPRRECLRKRRALRNTEFRARALEHMRLYRLHRNAARCETRRCAEKFDARQHDLERNIRAARSKRQQRWNSLRCPVVAPTTTEFPTTTTTTTTTSTSYAADAATVAFGVDGAVTTTSGALSNGFSTTAAPTMSPQNARRAALHRRLAELYSSIDSCTDELCKKPLLAEKRRLKAELRALSVERRARIDDERARHLRRARLNKRLARVYTKYSQCEDHACRVKVGTILAKFQSALDRLDRNILGSKKETPQEVWKGIQGNKYVRKLGERLKLCLAGDSKCTQEVFDSFRQATEERDAAVVALLRERVSAEVKSKIEACAAGKEREKCVAEVQKWEVSRLAQLQERSISLEKRKALRMCDGTANVVECRASVEKEFSRDVSRAATAAATAAASDVRAVVNQVDPSIGVPKVSSSGQIKPAVQRSSGGAGVATVASLALLAVMLALLL